MPRRVVKHTGTGCVFPVPGRNCRSDNEVSRLLFIQKEHGRMPNRTKQRRSGGLTLLLYQRTLHPELFKIHGSEQVSRRAYDADIWLVEGGHVITFVAGKHTLTEVILMGPGEMTDRGLIQTVP